MINSTEDYGPKDFLDIYNVRIRPSTMIFKNAYEGRRYTGKLTIQNIGKMKVLVKITSPTSFAFVIKSMIKAEELSPGLTISRTIKYTYSFANASPCQLPIYINENIYDYQIEVELPIEQLSISPDVVDFGTIDAGLTTAIRVLRVRNESKINSHFVLDFPKKKPKLIVEPTRGYITGMSFLDINIKLVSYEVGNLNTEIWINCKTPIRVPVKGEIIKSTFEPIYPTATETFTVIDFPPTYVGVKTTKNMLIKNISSLCNMFCVHGEINRECLTLEACREQLYYYNFFRILPSDGRFEPQESKLFQFVFEPQKRREVTTETYFLCAFLIYRVRCQDVVAGRFPGGVFMNEAPQTYSDSTSTIHTISETHFLPNSPLLISDLSEIDFKPTIAHFEHPFIRIFLHAVPEVPSVAVTPDEIILTGLSLGAKSTRVLEFKNKSNRLPIILHYKKVPYVDVERAVIFLKPSASAQIAIFVTPYKHGQVSTKITFDLLFYDCPKVKEDTYNVIGQASASLQFDTQLATKYPKPETHCGLSSRYIRINAIYGDINLSKGELVAFPNDTQRSIRPWRSSVPCRTIFTRQNRYIAPPDTSYELLITDVLFKRQIANFYTNFVREEAERLRRMSIKKLDPVADYTLTIESKLLCAIPPVQCPDSCSPVRVKSRCIIPLTPAQMNNVVISPSFIDTGSIAADHCCEFKIYITNNNPFPVMIYLRPDKPNVLFPNGNRREIKPNAQSDILIAYMQSKVGCYVLTLDLVVNDCMFVTVTMVANVVPGVIPLTVSEIEFKDDITQDFYELHNVLNVPIPFEWSWYGENFAVHPQHGVVPAGCCTICIIKTFPFVEGSPQTDLYLRTDQTNLQRVKLTSCISPKHVVLMPKRLIFKDMALNRPVVQNVTIHNRHAHQVGFQVLGCELGDIVLVSPATGIIPPLARSSLAIRVMMPHCVMFNTKLRIKIIHAGILELALEGNVVYPFIKITPNVLQFGKLMASTTDTIQFRVANTSQNEVSVKFNMAEHHDFKVSEEEFYWSPAATTNYFINVHEKKTFYLHFCPLEMSSSIFYLPIVVNEIIGPPIYTDPITERVEYYLTEPPPDTTFIHLPSQIACIKTSAFAIKPKIRLSSIFLKFVYYPQLPRLTKRTHKLTLTNNQDRNEDVCIRTDHFKEPFHIDNIIAKDVKYLEKGFIISMSPKSKVVLHLLFNPQDYCIAESFLPLYIRSENGLNCSSKVYLCGKYKAPSIEIDGTTTFYCKPYPLQHTTVNSKVVKFRNHFKECTVFTHTDLAELTIELKRDTYIKLNDTTYIMECLFKTCFQTNVKFQSVIKLHCTCGSVWQAMIVGCAENCLLTNYAFADIFLCENQSISKHCLQQSSSIYSEISNPSISKRILLETQFQTSNFFTSYPFFPFDDTFDTQDYIEKNLTDFLQGVVNSVEIWFSAQVLFGSVYHSLPNGMNSVSFVGVDRHGKKIQKLDIPFVNGLLHLVGEQIREILPLKPIPTDPFEQTYFLYNIYQHIINFLKLKGASFSYLQPEFLLPYDKYAEFSNYTYKTTSKKSPLTDNVLLLPQFFYLAKQSWCDLLLQTYKVLCLFRVTNQNITKSSSSTIQQSPMGGFLSAYNLIAPKFDNRFSTTEILLIEWLQYHFNAAKEELWANKCTLLKKINFFGNGLQDGLVFGAVTAVYCPYLRKYFEKLYLNPIGQDQVYHNNLVVLKSWDILNFSFQVTTENLGHPNCVHMLMLAAYLYDIMPFMYPSETIEFKAPLSEKKRVEIVLKNCNDFPIAYKPILFGNENGCFTTGCDTRFVVPPQKCKTLVITYHAKHIEPVKAHLLLSGECRGYHYAKNKCLSINGMPELVHPSSTFNLSYPLYTFNVVDITVQSPYKIAAKYGLKLVWDENITYELLQRSKFTHEFTYINYNRIGVYNKEAIFNKSGVGKVSLHVAPGFYVHFVYYLYFINDDVGHFMVKLITKCKMPKIAVTLPVVMPNGVSKSIKNLPIPTVYLSIPRRNTLLWDFARLSTVNLSKGDERKFWLKYSGSTLGIHMLEKRFSETNLVMIPRELFYCPKTYTVTVTDNKNLISLQSEVSLGYECNSGHVKVPITFLPECTTIPDSFAFQMVSACGRCRRNYIAKFKYVDDERGYSVK